MDYDMTSQTGAVAATCLLVQAIKTWTPVVKHIPIWLIALTVSTIVTGSLWYFGIFSGDVKVLGVNCAFNALASSGAFTWATGSAGRKADPEPTPESPDRTPPAA